MISIDSVAMSKVTPDLRQIKRTLESVRFPAVEAKAETRRESRHVQHVEEAEQKKGEMPKIGKVGDAWLQRSSEQHSGKGKLKRESTMDRLKEREGYESTSRSGSSRVSALLSLLRRRGRGRQTGLPAVLLRGRVAIRKRALGGRARPEET